MDHHYFGSTINTWVVGETLEEVKTLLKPLTHEVFVAIYRVPRPLDFVYNIEFYMPVVEGTVLVIANEGFFEPGIEGVTYTGDKL